MKNGVLFQYFEWNLPNDGKLWTRLKEDAEHLAAAGITAVWIPPAYKADEQQDEGYATYDLYDFGEFDQKGTVRTKYGTREELQSAIDALHANSVEVLLDAVLNHKAGADYPERFKVIEVYDDDRRRERGRVKKIEAMTGYSFKGRKGKYSTFKWHWYDFTGVDYDRKRRKRAIYRIVGPGKGWSQGVDSENGNYDYLLANDIDLNRKQVIEELHRWGDWAVKEFGFDGFRMDAVKHMDYNFTREFLKSVRKNSGKDLYSVAEYWSGDLERLSTYIDHTEGVTDLFDVPLHNNFHTASERGKDFDMSALLDGTLVKTDPTHAATFVENHDTQPGSSLESTVADWFKPMAYGTILLMKEGYPVIFYGDYYTMKGVESPHREIIDRLLEARRKYAYGEQTLYFDHPSCVGLIRHGDEEHPGTGLVFLMSNDEDGVKTVDFGTVRGKSEWRDLTGCFEGHITLDENGRGEFPVKGRNLSVWVPAD